MLYVFIRKNCIFGWDEPVNTEACILDADAPVCFGCVKVIAFILENCRFAQHGETVGKTSRYEKLPMVLLGL